jgi:hypothetical protein
MTLTDEPSRAAAPGPRERAPEPALPALDRIFAIAGGRVTGRAHQRLGHGCQDSLAWYAAAGALVAVVTDGCGSSQHSEVGARLGARLLASALVRRLERAAAPDDAPGDAPGDVPGDAPGDAPDDAIDGAPGEAPGDAIDGALVTRACDDMLTHLRVLAQAMGGDFARTVSEHFLFTVVGAVVTPARTLVFALGDGIVAINGAVHFIGPFPGNCPPYPGYALLDAGAPLALSFQVTEPTAAIDSVLLATDGAGEILAQPGRCLPGRSEPVGPLAQFWTDDGFFRNPDAVRRRLWLMSREHVTADWQERRLCRDTGILGDDTTIISIRRRGDVCP